MLNSGKKFAINLSLAFLELFYAGLYGQRVWVCGESEKVNPSTGALISSGSYTGSQTVADTPAKLKNLVWNDTTRTITLVCARGEILGFQVIIEARGKNLTGVTLSATDLKGLGGALIGRAAYEYFLEYYIDKGGSRYPDPLIPLDLVPDYRIFSIPDQAIHGFDNTNQAVWVDLSVPGNAAPGIYTGRLVVLSDQGGAAELLVNLTVYGFTLPDQCNYDYEFNHYGALQRNWPAGFALDEATFLEFERNAYRLCHKNRIRLNLVPYTQSGTPAGWLTSSLWPELADSAENIHVADWSAWDERFGPYLDGSAFTGLPRSGTPLESWMLPFNHRFPSDFNKHWTGQTSNYPYLGKMQVYELENRTIMAEFERHFNEKGWRDPLYMVFYNEKGRGQYNNQLPWFLDEPVQKEDFEALRFYSGIFHSGFSNVLRTPADLGNAARTLNGFLNPEAARFAFRADIGSQNRLQGYLDGYLDLWNIGGAADEDRYTFSEVAARRDKGELLYFYGPWSYGLDEYNLNLLWSGWNDWRRGATGHELWLVLGWTEAMAGDWNDVVNDTYRGRTTYLYPGYRLGLNTPLPTTRMKVIRRGVQDWEYLYRLALLGGSKAESDALVENLMGSGDRTYSSDVDDYNLVEESFAQARARVAERILAEGGDPPAEVPGDYNGDGKLSVTDVIAMIRRMAASLDDPALDFNHDGKVAISDAVALILAILHQL